MTKLKEIYRCEMCGNMVEVVRAAGGNLTCCGKPMTLVDENTVEASREKHVPVIEKIEDGYIVRIGSIAHPMEEKHYIEWIELVTEKRIYRKHLKPGDKPEAIFKTDCACPVAAREYCNLHGLWKAE